MRGTVLERFEAKFVKGPGCWLWTAGCSEGYGSLRLVEVGKTERAHRLAWILYRGRPQRTIAADHNIGQPLVSRIQARKRWTHVE